MEKNKARAVLVDISKESGLDSCIRGRRNATPFSRLVKKSCKDTDFSSAGRSQVRLDLAGQTCLQRNVEEIGRTDPEWER